MKAFAKPWTWQRVIAKTTKSLVGLLLILSLASCGDKATSTEPFTSGQRDNPQLTNQISEVSPPPVIQELRRSLEIYRPQVKIVSPQPDEILQDDRLEVKFEVKDLKLFQNSEYKLGPHLHVILDNEPYVAVYDVSKPLTLPNLSPGTHTLRAFASRPWHESFKNEGAYAQTTFHVFTKTDENNPDSSQPLLTYSRPKGDYGAEPILLDFYLTNAPLQIGGKDILKDEIGDWRIRCTINGETFVLDRWESIHLKGFKPGKNWVKLEFLDGNGNVIDNVFNSTVRSITYDPQAKDALSKIVRGELSADQVRGIVDQNYTAIPVVEPKIEPKLKPTVEPTQQTQPEEKPVTPEIETPKIEIQLEKPKSDGFFKRPTIKAPAPEPTIEPTPNETPDLPEVIIEEPATTAEPEPAITPTPKPIVPPVEKPNFGKFFKRPSLDKPEVPAATPSTSPVLQSPTSEPEVIPTPEPEVIPTPTPKVIPTPKPEITPTPKPEITPTPKPEITPTTEPQATEEAIPPTTPTQPVRTNLGKYFQRSQKTPLPTVENSPAPEVHKEPTEVPTPQPIAPNPEQPELKRLFNPNQYPNTPSSPSLPTSSS